MYIREYLIGIKFRWTKFSVDINFSIVRDSRHFSEILSDEVNFGINFTFFTNYLLVTKNFTHRYEMYKDNPETQRNMPLVSSALYWSHGLFTKIEQSMKQLKTVKMATCLKG